MPQKLTLKKLIDSLIHESSGPFTAEDFVCRVEKRWQRKISKSTLGRLKRRLSDHDSLIGTNVNDFLPYQTVLKKIGHIPLSITLGKLEWDQKIFIPGHRLLPYLSPNCTEKDVTFLDPLGSEIPKQKRAFLIEEVLHYYHYAGGQHFPDEVKVNEWMPVKSSLALTVWDIESVLKTFLLGSTGLFRVKLLDYERAIFQIQPYSEADFHSNKLIKRSFHSALEMVLAELYEKEPFQSSGLQKQILHALYSLPGEHLKIPEFSLTEFLENLAQLTVVSHETGAIQLVPVWTLETVGFTRKEKPRIPKGETGSLEKIFLDLGLAFQASEFKSILYTVMSTDNLKIEEVFHLLFGGEGKLFLNRKQHDAFYSHLRKLLFVICEDLKTPESILVSGLRDKCVNIKLGLIGILRFLENNEVGLQDLPADTLAQIIELDQFCSDNLSRLSNRLEPPNVKFIGDLRLSLKMILPHLNQVEEEVYSQLGFY